jgi:hypothetical protein
MRKNLARRSAIMIATMAAASGAFGLTAGAAHADCLTYSETQHISATVPTPYGPTTVSAPAPTDVNPHDCITFITGG